MQSTSILVLAPLLLLVACSPALPSVDYGNADSPCDISEGQIGERVTVGGLIAFTDDTAPDGWYADLERDGCRIGVWVLTGKLSTWQSAVPQAFEEGAIATFEGRLTSQPLPNRPDEYQLIVEADKQPQLLMTSAGEVEAPRHDIPACEFSGVEVGQAVETSGEVILKDDSAAAGVYIELESEDCYSRVWVERRFWDEWSQEQKNVLTPGNQVTVSGILTVVRGDQTVDISDPALRISP